MSYGCDKYDRGVLKHDPIRVPKHHPGTKNIENYQKKLGVPTTLLHQSKALSLRNRSIRVPKRHSGKKNPSNCKKLWGWPLGWGPQGFPWRITTHKRSSQPEDPSGSQSTTQAKNFFKNLQKKNPSCYGPNKNPHIYIYIYTLIYLFLYLLIIMYVHIYDISRLM